MSASASRRASILRCLCPCLVSSKKQSAAASAAVLNKREKDSLLSMYGLEELSEVRLPQLK